MSNLFCLTDEQMELLKPFFPRTIANRVLMIGGC